MIVYGKNRVQLLTKLTPCSCPSCGSKESIYIQVYRSHFHLFWIPMFPIRKSGQAVCSVCGAEYKKKKMSDSIKVEFENSLLRAKGPWWQLSGAIIAGLFILFMVFEYEDKKRLENEFIKTPQVGDVYQTREELRFSSWKLVDLTKDSLYFYENKYTVGRIRHLENIENDSCYEAGLTLMYHKKEIEKLFQDGIIFTVNRKN